MHRLESYEEWLGHDGKTVYLRTETGKPYACYVRWSTDVLDSSPETYGEVLSQCRNLAYD